MLSFAVAGVVALLAALCYAELASSVPTAGSAYSYAYATVGELIAWIIGWDLFLEFALGAAVVARGMGKPCVSGAGAIRVDYAAETVTANGRVLKRGDVITLDGSTGQVLKGDVPKIHEVRICSMPP